MDGVEQRVPPQNNEAEQAVLGSMLVDRNAITCATNYLQPEDFYQYRHQIIYRAILNIYERGEEADPITVQNELQKMGKLGESGGAPYLAELFSGVFTTANVENYAQIVRESATRRKALLLARTIQDAMYNPNADLEATLARAQQALLDVSTGTAAKEYVHLSDAAVNAYTRVEMLSQIKAKITGVPTGYMELDQYTSGWQPSDLIIVAARPSVGKTAFVLNVARNAAAQGAKVLFFSLEMSAEQLAMRLLAAESAINSANLRTGQLTDPEWVRLVAALDKLSGLDIFIEDTPNLSLTEVRAIARKVKTLYGCDLIVIDYLQLMSGDRRSESRQQEISDISRGCKQLARELKVPVIALSQLSRSVEQRQDKHPMLSDLRDSGSIEQDADIVSFLYRDDYYVKTDDAGKQSMVEVIIAKHRNGPTGTIKLWFHRDIQKFFNMEKHMEKREAS